MSMQPQSIPSVPPDTEAVARAAFPKGNIYVLLRDNLGSIYSDVDFAALFSKRGQPAQSPWQLALISVMQFVENLSDRQAALICTFPHRLEIRFKLAFDRCRFSFFNSHRIPPALN